MTVARENQASRLMTELAGQGLTGKSAEHGMAVKVTHAGGELLVWLPEEMHDEFIWGRTNEHSAPGSWPLPQVAQAIRWTLQ